MRGGRGMERDYYKARLDPSPKVQSASLLLGFFFLPYSIPAAGNGLREFYRFSAIIDVQPVAI
jgi:hypothetical protein